MAEIVERRGSSFSGIFRLLFVLLELLLAVIVLILGAAFVLSLFGANPNAEFAQWIYTRADGFMRPFSGLFDPISLGEGSSLNLSLLVGMAVYAVIGMVLEGISRRV